MSPWVGVLQRYRQQDVGGIIAGRDDLIRMHIRALSTDLVKDFLNLLLTT